MFIFVLLLCRLCGFWCDTIVVKKVCVVYHLGLYRVSNRFGDTIVIEKVHTVRHLGQNYVAF